MPFDKYGTYYHVDDEYEDEEIDSDTKYAGVFTIDEDEVQRVFRESFNELKADVTTDMTNIGSKIDNLYKQISILDCQIEKLENKHDSLNEEVEYLIKKIKSRG